ncbi:hypothetical protein MASR1M32_39730 [Rhodobacter sp.]
MSAIPTAREILARLIAFDTVSSNPNRALMDYVTGLPAGAGIDSLLVPDAAGGKANLYATVGPAGAAASCFRAIPMWCRSRGRPGPGRRSS